MPTIQISATVNENLYKEFEALRTETGQKRSEAVAQAIKMWIKQQNDALIAEGCRASKKEDTALAKASRRKTLKALAGNLIRAKRESSASYAR